MKIISLLLFLFTSLCSYGQDLVRTPIAGTPLTILLPNVNDAAKHASIIKINDFDLNFMDLTGPGMLKKFKDEVDSASMNAEGIKVVECKELNTHDYSGKIFIVAPNSSDYGISCYFGDSTHAILVSAQYPKEDRETQEKIINALNSIRKNKKSQVIWDDFLSYNYDSGNIFKIDSNQNSNTMIRFSSHGISLLNLFKKTNISSLQYPPTSELNNAEDVILDMLPSTLSSMEIIEVLKDKKINTDGKDEYHFNAICKNSELQFEIYCIAYYSEFSCVYLTAFIIDDEYAFEAIDFIQKINLKEDGY